MLKSGIANLPLHHGKAPPWLFRNMVKLAGAVSEAIIDEMGSTTLIKRLSNPFWFQSFSCLLGYDWHSSGTTTVTMGALKEALKGHDSVRVFGGKGAASRKTPHEIAEQAPEMGISSSKASSLVDVSRTAAKVDSALVQDGFTLYHHTIIVDKKARWGVVQQGMNDSTGYARRYHWDDRLAGEMINEPHSAVCSDARVKTLNMTAADSEQVRKLSVDIVNEGSFERLSAQMKLSDFISHEYRKLSMPRHHMILFSNKRNLESLRRASAIAPSNYRELLMIRGIGASAIRSLALASRLIYGEEPSWRDPVNYSFAHGGKDGFPYPVNYKNYAKTIEVMRQAVDEARVGERAKMHALRNLSSYFRLGGSATF